MDQAANKWYKSKVVITSFILLVALVVFVEARNSKKTAEGEAAQSQNQQQGEWQEGASGLVVPPEKGYAMEKIGDGIYFVTDGTYNTMFMTTGKGVIVVDAPPSLGDKILKAMAEVTKEPITHVIYSHSHADHIGAAGIYPKDATYIAQEETLAQLKSHEIPKRLAPYGSFIWGGPVPTPTVTFTNDYTLVTGSQTLQLSYKGPAHEPGNIFIYAPKQKVLMVVDVILPGSSPFFNLGLSEDVPAYLAAHDTILSYDFTTLVAGHPGRTGTRKDVETQKEFVMDIRDNAASALKSVDFMAIANEVGYSNPWKLNDAYFGALVDKCVEPTKSKWVGKLSGMDVDTFTKSHCMAMINSLRID